MIETSDDSRTAPGRACPLHYRYAPEVFDTAASPSLAALDALYVVGGLYGNELALEHVLDLFDAEVGRKRLVFNGDFHWFDADPAVFERVQRAVLSHQALRGNVETELSAEPSASETDTGCGCAYPDWVGDDVVERSNRILRRLRGAVSASQRQELAALPMWLRADVGHLKLGIVHGDAQSLAGWGFAQESLREPAHRQQVRAWFERARVDAFACSHTCLPVYHALRRPAASPGWVLNNGAAGMPNFAGDSAGLFTRVALSAFEGEQRRFGVKDGDVFVDAIALEVDPSQWRQRFLRQWPEGSDAHASYFQRIVRGPSYALGETVRTED